jgi:predicted Zn-dependent protease
MFLHLISNDEDAGKLRGSGLFPPHYGPPAPPSDARVIEANRLLVRALEIDPLSAPAQFHQHDQDPQTGYSSREEAESQLSALLAVDPDFYPALVRLAKYSWWFHDSPSEAIALIERAIATDPRNPLAYHAAAAYYLDIDDAAAAADVAAATPVSAITATAVLKLHAGDWRSAGLMAMKQESFVFEGLEDSGSAQALRDYALRTRDYASAETLLCTRYAMTTDGPIAIDLYNLRIWVLLAHLQLVRGNTARANQVLEAVIAWIDTEYGKWGPVFARRTRAQALMLLGRRDEALRDLAAGFAVDHDHVEWWYTIERDPVYDEVRESAEFRALAADARRFAARERAAVEELRRQGKIPRRPAT